MPPPSFAEHALLLRAMASRYIWWRGPEIADEWPARVVAQVLSFTGGGEGPEVTKDQETLRRALGDEELRHVLAVAEAGWFGEASWRIWRDRLGLPSAPLPDRNRWR